jgi:hypothetical protein
MGQFSFGGPDEGRTASEDMPMDMADVDMDDGMDIE